MLLGLMMSWGLLHYTDDNNATFQAIKGYYQECKRYAPVQKNPIFISKKNGGNDI